MPAQPDVEHFGTFSGPDIGIAVAHYLDRAAVQEPGTVPMLATYRLVYGHCGHWSDPASEQQAYHDFISRFAAGVGGHRAVLFLEMDSLITVGCLSHQGVAVRMHELDDAINVLTANCPHLVVYLDAGAADAVPAPQIAKLLRRAGVAKIQGFFLNSTHFDWTTKEISYGEQISRLTGGKHFVVNTAENGRGPLVPRNRVKNGNEVLCNPLNRGLGPVPTANTGFRNVDAFAWIANPGKSGGQCRAGAPKTGNFWLALALELVRNANYRVSYASASAGRGRVIVPHPITSSPSIRHAICAGRRDVGGIGPAPTSATAACPGRLLHHARCKRPRAVAELHAVDARALAAKAGVAKRHARALQRLARPDHDAV